MKGFRLHLFILVGTTAAALSLDWGKTLAGLRLPAPILAAVYFLLVKVISDLILALASSRERSPIFYGDYAIDLAFYAVLGVAAAIGIEVAATVLRGRANPAAVAVLANLGIIVLGGTRR
ncbi:MAG TPA: hypothetical protein DEQ28_07605 [Clostridiales bacterium]|nr:hypothetical protein [Clostridiales bacterium]